MSYEPTVWKKGDIVTSEKLNKLENGVAAGGVFCVDVTETETGSVLGNTWQEIHDALANGSYAYARAYHSEVNEYGIGIITNINYFDGTYTVKVIFNGDESMSFTTSTSDGYPEWTEE